MDYEEIQKTKAAFEDVPGTYMFNSGRLRKGYHLNMFCMSMQKPDNREEFLADERAYLDKFPMTEEQKQAVLDRDWLGMIQSGGNIYFTAKLGATLGHSFQYLAGAMTGMGQDRYRKMMVEGGRTPNGNRSKSENNGKVVEK